MRPVRIEWENQRLKGKMLTNRLSENESKSIPESATNKWSKALFDKLRIQLTVRIEIRPAVPTSATLPFAAVGRSA